MVTYWNSLIIKLNLQFFLYPRCKNSPPRKKKKKKPVKYGTMYCQKPNIYIKIIIIISIILFYFSSLKAQAGATSCTSGCTFVANSDSCTKILQVSGGSARGLSSGMEQQLPHNFFLSFVLQLEFLFCFLQFQ